MLISYHIGTVDQQEWPLTSKADLYFQDRVITKLKGKYVQTVQRILQIFDEKGINIETLITYLCSCDENNLTIFSTDEAFVKVRNTTQLFHFIGRYCSIYDYELLLSLVESAGCEEAIELLDDFAEQLKSSILKSLDLLSEDGKVKNPQVSPGTHTLKVKYEGGKCTLEKIKMIKKVLYEVFKLNTVSIIFRGAEDGCVTFVYQVSNAVKLYMLQYQITNLDTALLTKCNIARLLIDNEELIALSQGQKVVLIVCFIL